MWYDFGIYFIMYTVCAADYRNLCQFIKNKPLLIYLTYLSLILHKPVIKFLLPLQLTFTRWVLLGLLIINNPFVFFDGLLDGPLPHIVVQYLWHIRFLEHGLFFDELVVHVISFLPYKSEILNSLLSAHCISIT